MILLDGPHVSDFLLDTLARNGFPVIDTPYALSACRSRPLSLVPEADAVRRLATNPGERLYTPSENALAWVGRHLRGTRWPGQIALFKNKARFRELLRPLYPDFRFRTVEAETLLRMPAAGLALPCVVKPTTGFFSLGVRPVFTGEDFLEMQRGLRSDLERIFPPAPEGAFHERSFLIEDYIPGDEYAVDAYFDERGRPVVLGIFRHLFASGSDVSDRVYTTSAGVVGPNLEPVTGILGQIGRLAGVRQFPLHAEFRRRQDGTLVPVEVNPLRFGGWCTTPDLARYAWGLNVYEQFLCGQRPDWPALLSGKGDTASSLVVLENSTGIDGADIRAFDYDAVLGLFSKPLELTRIDFRSHPLFGFLFVETDRGGTGELERILRDDLRSYIEVA